MPKYYTDEPRRPEPKQTPPTTILDKIHELPQAAQKLADAVETLNAGLDDKGDASVEQEFKAVCGHVDEILHLMTTLKTGLLSSVISGTTMLIQDNTLNNQTTPDESILPFPEMPEESGSKETE